MTAAREVDAATVNEWVARELFGYRQISVARQFAGKSRLQGLRPDDEDSDYRSPIPDYLRDANADALVREKVEVRFDWRAICDAVDDLACNRATDEFLQSERRERMRIFDKTGDWSIAAYAVGNNMDPVEVERMVRGG